VKGIIRGRIVIGGTKNKRMKRKKSMRRKDEK
jgi:hypothetical protein